jgi:hypothetical protein
MTAGTGIYHSEFNLSEDEPVELLQIWIIPEKQGLSPRYGQEKIPEGVTDNKLYKIVSYLSSGGLLEINQKVNIYLAELNEAKGIEHIIPAGNGVYLYLIAGEINVNDINLKKGDAAKILNEELIKIYAVAESRLILFDVII